MARPSAQNFRSVAALACFLLTAVIGFGLDQWSKAAAFRDLAHGMTEGIDGRPVPDQPRSLHFIPGWLHFDVTSNYGAVFGIGQGQRSLFIVVSVAAILFIFYLFATSDGQRVYQLILGMLLAGVLGNLYDRLVFGYVRDMIHALPRWPGFFPWIFNVADSLLCVGVFLMIVYSFFHNPQKVESPQPT